MAGGRIRDMLPELLRRIPWQSFDVSSDQGRTSERYRRALLTTCANVLSKALSLLVLVVSVPLTLSYLGNERFGIWMTISSFATLFAFLDLGIGNGLLNLVAKTAATGGHDRLRQVVSNGLLALVIAGILVGTALLTASSVLPWQSLIRVADPSSIEEIRSAANTFALIFALSLPLLGLQRVFLGLQEGFLVHVASALAQIISLILVVILAANQAGIPQLIVATYGVQSLAPLILLPLLQRRGLMGRPGLGPFRSDALHLLRTGSLFFVLQLGAVVAWGSDSLIISSMLGASEVATLAIISRLFQLVTQPLAMFSTPLWSGYADAAARNDSRYIRQTLKNSMAITFGSALIGALVVLTFHDWLITHWTSNSVQVPMLLATTYAAWTIVEATGNTFAMFLNGLGILRAQLIVVSLFCTVAIPLKLLLVNQIGLVGVIMATLISYCLTVALPYLTFLRPTWTTRIST